MQRLLCHLWLLVWLACQPCAVVSFAQPDDRREYIDQLAQTDAWQSHIDESAGEEVEYEEAREHLDQALEIAEKFGPEDPRLSQTLKALGDLEYGFDDPDSAEPSYKWVFDLRKGDNLQPAFDWSHHDEAEGFYERALKIREDHLDPNDLDLARSHQDLAEIYYRGGREDEAAEHFERARDILQEVLGEDHADAAHIWTRIGWNQFYLDEFDEAEKSFQHAIALRIAANAEPENIADYREELGRFYVKRGQPEKATETFDQVLSILVGLWGESDSRFLAKLRELGEVHGLLDQRGEREALLQRVLRIQERAHGPDSIEAAEALFALGDFWNSGSTQGIAEHFYRRSAGIREATEGESLALAHDLTCVSSMLRQQERYREAIEPAQRAYAIRSAQLDAPDERIIQSLYHLASLYGFTEDYDEAAVYYDELVAIREVENPTSDDLASALRSLGGTYLQAGRPDNAVEAFERAVAILEAHDDPPFDLDGALFQLADAYEAQGRVGDAAAARNRAEKIRSEQFQNALSAGWKQFVEKTFGSTSGWVIVPLILLFVGIILGIAAGMTALGAVLVRKLLRQHEPPPGAPVEPETPEPTETGPPAPIILPGESAPQPAHAGETGAVGSVWAVPTPVDWTPAALEPPPVAEVSPAGAPPIILPPEAATTSPPEEPSEPIVTRRFGFRGQGGSLFGIHIVNMLLALLTLGIYYFWGKIKALKYVYSQAEFDGDRFAFHGTGKELFLGWLRVIPFILLLYFFPQILGMLWDSELAQIIGVVVLVVGITVIIPIAQIGAYRYRLSRTSWRGIRFSFRGRTKKYFLIYLKGLALTLLSLGLYSPVMMVELLRYQYANTYFGNTKLRFHARAIEIFPAFILSWVLSFATLGLFGFWYQAELARYFWSHTTFATSRMR